jgi:FdhD protein
MTALHAACCADENIGYIRYNIFSKKEVVTVIFLGGNILSPSNPPLQYLKYSAGSGWEPVESPVIREAPVTLTVNGEVWLTFMCTPAHLEALAVGFLYNEGIINDITEVASARPCQNDENIDVWLHKSVEKPSQWRRTSGCSGGQTQSQNPNNTETITSEFRFSPEILFQGMEQLLAAQELYREARGVHCSALSDGEKLLIQAEDIGRHNTLDKLVGLMLIEAIHPDHSIIFTTGRISSEMLQKSARMGASIVVSRTSPTSLSIETAEAFGITLVGYARRNQFNVYSCPERLMPSEAWTPVHQNVESAE